jgi:phage baseplate assembly protein W
MVEFPSSYTRLSRSDVQILKNLANDNLVSDPKKQFREIQNYTDTTGSLVNEKFILVTMVKVPSLRNPEDKMPRFVKNLKPFVYHTLNGGSVKNDNLRSVSRCYCVDAMDSFGYHIIDDSSGQKNILTNNTKLFYINTNNATDAIIPPIESAREIAYNPSGDALSTYSKSFDYSSTDNLYFAIGFKKSYLASLTEPDIQTLIENAPSYFVLRNQLKLSPILGFSLLDGTPVKLDSVSTQNVTIDGITTSTKIWNFKKYQRVESGVNIDDMLSRTGLSGILGFADNLYNNAGSSIEPAYPIGILDGFVGGIISRNADILMGRAGSLRKTNFFSALFQLVGALKQRYLSKADVTTDWSSYFSKLDHKVNYIKQLVESEALTNSIAVYNGIKSTTSYETDSTKELTSFPDQLLMRTDLVIGFNVKEDVEMDFDNWQVPYSDAPRYAIDIDMQDPDGVVYDEDAITESVLNIIMTGLNERMFDKDFGTPIQQLVFEKSTFDIGVLPRIISSAITKYEPRVICAENMVQVELGAVGTHQLNIRVAFVIKSNAKIALISRTILL